MEWYDHRIRQGIGRYAREHNWHLTVDERSLIPCGWKGDGVLTLFHRRDDILDYLRRLKMPVVDMGFYHPEIPLPRVIGDHRQIGILAAEHFAERGFMHTACFSTEVSPTHELRYQGFESTCEKLNMRIPLRWFWEESCPNSPDDWKQMRDWLTQKIRSAPKPLAIFALNDYDASKIEDVCREAHVIVPDEAVILGVDNNELICLNQPIAISSIAHDLTRVGYESSALLDRLMDGATVPKAPILISPIGVVLRQTTDTSATNHDQIRNALCYIKANLSRSFSSSDVAESVGLSRSSLDRLFLQELNRSVHHEVTRVRLLEVKRLLTQTDISITSIAKQTGFCHAQYLNRLFRKFTTQTPLAYRKQHVLAKKI